MMMGKPCVDHSDVRDATKLPWLRRLSLLLSLVNRRQRVLTYPGQ